MGRITSALSVPPTASGAAGFGIRGSYKDHHPPFPAPSLAADSGVGWKNSELYGEKLGALRRDLNLSRGGVHTLQFLQGCEVSPDGRLQRGFYQDAYDRQEDVASDVKTWTWTWTVFVPQVEISKHSWEEESEAERRLSLQECVQWLHNYLEMGKEALTRTDPPSVRVTLSDTAHHGKVTLTCRAQDFYPAKISLTWLRDEEEQLQDTEFIETRPGGDGTFQKWAAVGVTPGQEGSYTCQVQHKGLAEPLTLKWENNKTSSSSTWTILGVTVGVFLLLLAVAVVVFWRKKNSGRGEACGQAADNDRAQGTDVPLQSLNQMYSVARSEELEDYRCPRMGGDQSEVTCPLDKGQTGP